MGLGVRDPMLTNGQGQNTKCTIPRANSATGMSHAEMQNNLCKIARKNSVPTGLVLGTALSQRKECAVPSTKPVRILPAGYFNKGRLVCISVCSIPVADTSVCNHFSCKLLATE